MIKIVFDNIKDVLGLVSGTRFQVQFFDKQDNLIDIKEMNIPDINLYLMGKEPKEIVITIIES